MTMTHSSAWPRGQSEPGPCFSILMSSCTIEAAHKNMAVTLAGLGWAGALHSQPVPRESPVAGWRPSLKTKKESSAVFLKTSETGAGCCLSSGVILRDKNTPPPPASLIAEASESLFMRKDTAGQAGATSSALRPDGSQEVLMAPLVALGFGDGRM